MKCKFLQAGPSHAMNWYNPGGNTTVPAGPRGASPNAMCGNAVMYDAVNGKILTLGGAPDYGVRAVRFCGRSEALTAPLPWACSITRR